MLLLNLETLRLGQLLLKRIPKKLLVEHSLTGPGVNDICWVDSLADCLKANL